MTAFRPLALAGAAVVALAACAPNGVANGQQTAAPAQPGQPGQPAGPATSATPAMTVVREAAVPNQQDVDRDEWVTGLEHPWGLVFLPDGRALVTERPGRVRLIEANGRLSQPLQGVPGVFAENQGGMLDITIHPHFDQNRLVYMVYSTGNERANRIEVMRARLDGNRLVDGRVIARNPEDKERAQHFGARFLWLADGTMLLAVGDGGNPPNQFRGRLIREQAQNPETWFGSVLRLTADGEPAPGNPNLGGDPRLWTMGHRNIQGLARDPQTGAVWATEHGSLGGDLLNLLEAGSNYGWPLTSWGREYRDGSQIAPRTRQGMVDPRLVWMMTFAPSGLAVYRGQAFPEWQGNLLAGGLMTQDVRRIVLDSQGRVTYERRIPIEARVRDVRVGPDGLIYVLTDEGEGRIYRIRPRPGATN